MKFLAKETYQFDQRIYVIEGMVRLPPTMMVNPLKHPPRDVIIAVPNESRVPTGYMVKASNIAGGVRLAQADQRQRDVWLNEVFSRVDSK